MSVVDIICFYSLLISSGYGTLKVGQFLGLRCWLSLILFLWHTSFCLVYWFYAKSNVADANNYFDAAAAGRFYWSPGTSFIESFTALFVSGLGLGKLNTYLIFNIFGVAGLLLLAHVLLNNWPARRGWRRAFPYLLLLMPGLSFWSAAIGKDAPAFFASCLACYSFLDVTRRKSAFALAVLVMFAARPHVAAFMLLAGCCALLTGRNIGSGLRLFIAFVLIVATVFILPFVMEFVGLGEAISYEVVGDYLDQRQGSNLEGGGGVDISALPLPLKMFTYLFRPLFFDAPGLLGIVVSFENLFLLTVVSVYLMRGVHLLVGISSVSVRYNLIYLFLGLSTFSLTTANLGIAIRQKTMILPSLLFLTAFTAHKVIAKRQTRPSHAANHPTTKRSDSLTPATTQLSHLGAS